MTNSIRILSELFPKAINNCDSRSHIKIEDNANPSRKISGAVRAVSAKLHILSTKERRFSSLDLKIETAAPGQWRMSTQRLLHCVA